MHVWTVKCKKCGRNDVVSMVMYKDRPRSCHCCQSEDIECTVREAKFDVINMTIPKKGKIHAA